jgi:hypothetical protein
VVVERGVELVEQDRLFRHRIAGFGRVLAVVEADADDLFRVGDARAEARLVERDEETLGRGARVHPVEQALEPIGVAFALEQRVDRGRGVLAQVSFCQGNVEDAALRSHPETVAAWAAQRRENQALRELLRSAGRRRGALGKSGRRQGACARRRCSDESGGFQERPAILAHAFLLVGAGTALRAQSIPTAAIVDPSIDAPALGRREDAAKAPQASRPRQDWPLN